MTERPERISGTVVYWNGQSGWIRRDGVENVPTTEQGDVMLRIDDLESGYVRLHCRVEFEFDQALWIARNARTFSTMDLAPMPPDSPEVPW